MNSIDCGKFISELRKEKRLTQNELAEKLQVTNKAVSRWETGDGFPDVSILPTLADIFDVSVDEILRGKRKSNGDLRPDKRLKLRFSNHLLIIKGLLVLGYFSFLTLSYTTFKVWIGGIVFVVMGLASFIWFFIERNRYLALCDYNEGDRLTLFQEERKIVTTTATLSAMVLVMIALVGLTGMYANGVITFSDYVVWGSISGMLAFVLASAYYYAKGKQLKLDNPIDVAKSLAIVYAFVLAIPLAGNLNSLHSGTILYYLPVAIFAAAAFLALSKHRTKADTMLALLDGAFLIYLLLVVNRSEDFVYLVLVFLFFAMTILAFWLMIRGWILHTQSKAYVISVHFLSVVVFYATVASSAVFQTGEPILWIRQIGLVFYYLLLPFSLLLVRKHAKDSSNHTQSPHLTKEAEGIESQHNTNT